MKNTITIAAIALTSLITVGVGHSQGRDYSKNSRNANWHSVNHRPVVVVHRNTSPVRHRVDLRDRNFQTPHRPVAVGHKQPSVLREISKWVRSVKRFFRTI